MTDLDKATIKVARFAITIHPEFRIVFERLERMIRPTAVLSSAAVVGMDLPAARAILAAILRGDD